MRNAVKAYPASAPLSMAEAEIRRPREWVDRKAVENALLAAHAVGIWASRPRGKRSRKFEELSARNYYADALAAFKAKEAINGEEMQAVLDSLETGSRMATGEAIRQAAYDASFTMVREGNQVILERVAAQTETLIKELGTVGDFLHDINDIYAAAGVGDQQFWYNELVYANNTNRAFQEGVQLVAEEMDEDGILWGYEWIHSGSPHPRPAHLALDGFCAPKDDSRWADIGIPPIGHKCGCQRRAVTDAEAKDRGLKESPPTPHVSGEAIQELPPSARAGLTIDEQTNGLSALDALNKVPGERFPHSEYWIESRPLLNPSWGKKVA